MATRKTAASINIATTPAPTAVPSNAVAAFDYNAIIAEATATGRDAKELMEQKMAEIQAAATRTAALNSFGIMTCTINGSMPLTQDSNGTRTLLARFNEQENCKAQTGDNIKPFLEKVIAANPDLEIQLIISEKFWDRLQDKRSDLGGNIAVEFTVGANCEFRKIQARFSKDEEDIELRKKPIFLKSKEGGNTPDNWTSEDTGIPLMKLRLRVLVDSALQWKKGITIAQPLPNEDELLELALASQQVQSRNLGIWTQKRIAENEMQISGGLTTTETAEAAAALTDTLVNLPG